MNKVFGIGLAVIMAGMFGATPSLAEDKMLEFPVKEALASTIAKDKLTKEIPIYMKGQGHPGVSKTYGEFKSNKRSNGVGKSDQEACDIAFISALMAFQDRANREGGNGVIDIYSITKNQKHESAETYSCLAGRMMVNVALSGKVVTMGK